MQRLAITNFSRGEFGPELYGRIDIPQYGAGAKELTNFIIQRYGGAAFRPGFRFVGEVDNIDWNYRLIPFQFSIDQAYVLLFGDTQLRVLADGGFVTEDDLQIVSISNEATATVEIPYHDLSVGERFYIDGITGMTEINGIYGRVINVLDANHVQIDVDTTNFGLFTGSTGELRTGPPTPPPAPEPQPSDPPDPDPPPTTTSPNPDTGGSGTGTYPRDKQGGVRPQIP